MSAQAAGKLPTSRRSWLLFALLLAAAVSLTALDLDLESLVPRAGATEMLRDFWSGALHPALDYEASFVPAGTAPLLGKVLDAALRTLYFAAAGLSLAVFFALPLGFLASSSSGIRAEVCNDSWLVCVYRRLFGPALSWCVRILIAATRSVHELLWAVIFLAAFGLSDFACVLAIAIPYSGTLAKVYSEMLDECPRESAQAVAATGARGSQVFLFGLLPRALPDMAAYTFYRFECAVRSSAIMGFFGFPTLGYAIKLSFENLHYREVWTYLYALLLIVLLLEFWSAGLRRKVVAR